MEVENKGQQSEAEVAETATVEEKLKIEEEPKFAMSEVQSMIKEAKDEQYKKLNKSLVALGQENKRLRDERLKQPSPIDESDAALEFMVQREKKRAIETGEVDPEIAKLEEQLRLKKVQREREAQSQKIQRQYEEIRDNFHKQIVDAGLNPESEEFEPVIEAWEDGKFERAQRKLDKLLKTKVTPIKEDEAEIKRKKMEEEGKLKTDTGSLAGGNIGYFTRQQIASMSVKEYAEKRDAIDAAYKAGRVK